MKLKRAIAIPAEVYFPNLHFWIINKRFCFLVWTDSFPFLFNNVIFFQQYFINHLPCFSRGRNVSRTKPECNNFKRSCEKLNYKMRRQDARSNFFRRHLTKFYRRNIPWCSCQHISPRYHKRRYFFTVLLFTYLEKKNWIHCLARCIFKTPLNVNNYMVPQTLVGGREEFWIHETSLMRLSDRISLALMTLLFFFFPFFFLYLSKA